MNQNLLRFRFLDNKFKIEVKELRFEFEKKAKRLSKKNSQLKVTKVESRRNYKRVRAIEFCRNLQHQHVISLA